MASYKELLKQQEALALEVEAARKREISDAVNRVRELVSEYGLSERDVFPGGRKSSAAGVRPGGKVAPKYRDPATGQTWTGRGKAPKWIDGKDRDKYLIA